MNDNRTIDETRDRSRSSTRWYVQALRRLVVSLQAMDGPVLGRIARAALKLLNGLADSVTAGWLADDIDREGTEGE